MRDLLPKELLDKNERTILRDMMERVPSSIDKSEGHMLHDHLAPVAYQINDLINFQMRIALMAVFPQFAEGIYLDNHGDAINLKRRDSVPSVGYLTVEGEEGAIVPEGAIFSTNPSNKGDMIEFEAVEELVIDSTGIGKVKIRALEGGKHTNVTPYSISSSKHKGVSKVYNEEEMIGGTDVESDDSYRDRILERKRNRPASGNVHDYKDWVRQIDGVGDRVIVRRTPKGPKTVKVLITSSDGGMASPDLVKKVQDHIDPVRGEGLGLAPIGAHVEVVTVKYVKLDLDIEAVINNACTNSILLDGIEETINSYARGRSIIRYHSLIGLLVNSECVEDLISLEVNGSQEDIILKDEDEVGIVGEVYVNGKKLEE